MSWIDHLKTSLQTYVEELHRDRHPFLMPSPARLGFEWILRKGADGCRPIKTSATILMVKSPPPLPEDKGAPQKAPASANAGSTHKTASANPASLPSSAANAQSAALQKSEQNDCPAPPPFDMMDLPDAMSWIDFKYSAKFARKWFEGRAHVIEEEKRDQPAVIQPAEFVDKDTLKLGWILKFGTVGKRYAHLLAMGLSSSEEGNIYNEKAKQELKQKLTNFMTQRTGYFSGMLDTASECGNDIQKLHQQFQFQYAAVAMVDVLGGEIRILDEKVRGGQVMNDLAASLANFNLYAAIATAKISTSQYMRYDNPWQICTHSNVEITHVWIYAKDNYSFNDKTSASQYLGHWNRHGVIVANDALITHEISKQMKLRHGIELGNHPIFYLPTLPEHLDKPLDIGSNMKQKQVFYPVRNRDFRNWRDLKNRGGDFVIYSNCEKVKLTNPISIDLGEVCRKYKR